GRPRLPAVPPPTLSVTGFLAAHSYAFSLLDGSRQGARCDVFHGILLWGCSHLSYTGVGSEYCLLVFLVLVGFGIVFAGQSTGQDCCNLLEISPLGGW
ncbi:hypothetical protein, partial [Aeromonas caviae]|uniref:hypothetical protein n=1 Tax=Aeromonas caviae TaxID=648 RepID=UPI0019D4C8E9